MHYFHKALRVMSNLNECGQFFLFTIIKSAYSLICITNKKITKIIYRIYTTQKLLAF